MKRCLAVLALMVLAGISGPGASAQAGYPSKPITMVLPFAAGSGSDGTARFISGKLGAALNGSVLVDNKPGANGIIAAQIGARAKPDGYTLFVGSSTTYSMNPNTRSDLPYDPRKDFVPLARFATYPLVLVSLPTFPAKDLPALLARAKAEPGKLEYGYSNGSGLGAIEAFKEKAGVNILKVPYTSAGQMQIDLLSGRIRLAILDISIALPRIKAGEIIPITIFSERRSAALPDLPTAVESGVDVDLIPWVGLFAPAGTPPEITNRLSKELRGIAAQPDVVEYYASLGLVPETGDLAGFNAFLKKDYDSWTRLVKETGIQP